LLLGALAAALDLGLRLAMPAPLAAALLLVALTLVTGGLHLDGLMDTCDGVFNHSTPERRLEILGDARVGAYGAIGLALDLLLKYALLLSLPAPVRAVGLILAFVLAYWAMALAIFVFPAARPGGFGAAFKKVASGPRLVAAGASALLVAVGLGGAPGLALFAAGSAGAIAAGGYIAGKLGGLTGDTYGAVNETTLLATLLVWPLLNGGY
jgi:adenosylcobinamide-GDP ribazoletransferase